MPIHIEPYGLRVRDAGIPGARVAADSTNYGAVQQGLGQLAQGAGQLQGAVERNIAKHSDAAVMDAYAQLNDSDLQLRDLVRTVRGKDAVSASSVDENGNERNQIDSALKNYETNYAAIAGKLSGAARARFDHIASQKREQFNQYVNNHIGEQAEVAAKDAAEAASTAAINSASALARDISNMEVELAKAAGDGERRGLEHGIATNRRQLASDLATGRGAIEIYAQNHGIDPTIPVLKYTTGAHVAVLDAMRNGDGHGHAAKAYMEANRSEIDSDVLPKIEKAIEADIARDDGRAMARGTLVAAAVVSHRSWDPTPVARVDASKVAADLRRVEADSNVSDAVKAAYREHAEKELQDQQQAFHGVLNDVYTRAITKLEKNGNSLSALGAEKEFLLDDKVQGGDVWRSIVGRAKAKARGANAHNTPDQDRKWDEFLFSLEGSRQKYDDPSYTAADYGRDWADLSQRDHERGASYIASMRGQAARPDETLPPAVVREMVAKGGPDGFQWWGSKGPRSEQETARRVLIERDLLEAQRAAKAAGKPLEQSAVDEVLKKWGDKVEVDVPFWPNPRMSRAEYEADPDYADRSIVDPNAQAAPPAVVDPFDAVKPDEEKQIDAELARKGFPPTPEFRRWLFNVAHGVPDVQNPKPTRRAPRDIKL